MEKSPDPDNIAECVGLAIDLKSAPECGTVNVCIEVRKSCSLSLGRRQVIDADGTLSQSASPEALCEVRGEGAVKEEWDR